MGIGARAKQVDDDVGHADEGHLSGSGRPRSREAIRRLSAGRAGRARRGDAGALPEMVAPMAAPILSPARQLQGKAIPRERYDEELAID